MQSANVSSGRHTLSRPSAADSPKIHALTSVRFFAALYVVLFHIMYSAASNNPFQRVMALGYVAPYFFFLLSGYILSFVYLRSENPVDNRRFYIARFARIYPCLLLTALADIPFALMARVSANGLRVAWEHVIGLLGISVFMLQMAVHTGANLNGPSWSLSVEVAFYLTFPFIGPLLWRLSAKRSLLVLSLFYVAAMAVESFVFKRHEDAGKGIAAFHLISLELVFLCGILLARLQSYRKAKSPEYVMSDFWAWLVQLVALTFFILLVQAHPWLQSRWINTAYVLIPAYVAIVWTLANSRIMLVKLLSHPYLVILGEASYGLYLIHAPVVHFFRHFYRLDTWPSITLCVVISIILSVLSFYYFETPCRKAIIKKFRSGTKETMEAASAAQ